VGIDFAGGALYLERGLRDQTHDMDLVPLTLRPDRDGTYEVIGASPDAGAQPGDRLVRIGGTGVAGRSMGQVVDALRGRPGEKRKLTVRRGEEILSVEATVIRCL
jgi:hypothetical protein